MVIFHFCLLTCLTLQQVAYQSISLSYLLLCFIRVVTIYFYSFEELEGSFHSVDSEEQQYLSLKFVED